MTIYIPWQTWVPSRLRRQPDLDPDSDPDAESHADPEAHATPATTLGY